MFYQLSQEQCYLLQEAINSQMDILRQRIKDKHYAPSCLRNELLDIQRLKEISVVLYDGGCYI